MKLSKTQCDKLQIKSKSYKKFDGGGLYLEVTPNGSKLWRLKYYHQGKEKRLSLGKYPVITLKEARQKRDEAKKLLDQGKDPSFERQELVEQEKTINKHTFKYVADEWLAKQLPRWSFRREKSIRQMLNKNLIPYLGDLPISSINHVLLLSVIQKIEDRGAHYVANRTNQLAGRIFKYGMLTGRCETNPATVLVGVFQARPVEHFAAIDASEIPLFLIALQNNDARLFRTTRHAILFSMLTFCRPGEIRHARWQDISFEDSMWQIPKEFMKSRRDHFVPLSRQAIYILDQQRKQTAHLESQWVFPSIQKPDSPISDGTVNLAIRKLGYKGVMTAHGFRALARTTIREKLKYYPDIIEAQLAHKPMGYLGAAYDRAQFIDDRIKMMQDWADYIQAQLDQPMRQNSSQIMI